MTWQFWVIYSCSLPACFCTLELPQQIQSNATTVYACNTYLYYSRVFSFVLLYWWTAAWLTRTVFVTHRIALSGAFAKLQKATVSFMSVCQSAWNSSTLTEHIFMKFDMSIFRKSVTKIQVSLISDKKSRCFTWRLMSIYDNMSLIYC